MSASVCVRTLTKRYGAITALDGVSFDVPAGEIFGLLGVNGAGKTTTLECLLGLRRPDGGSISVDGIDALAEPERVKAFIGAQLQATALQDKITPREALRLFGAFYRNATSADELLARFALTAKADAPFDSLSGGQRQRVSLALAFVNKPKLLVLDEPTAGLDPQARRELHRVLIDARAAGQTIVLSTHYLEEAHQLCDRIAIIDAGRIIATAGPEELIERSGCPAHVVVRTTRPLEKAALSALDAVSGCEWRDGAWWLATSNANRTVIALTTLLERAGNPLRELHVRPPSLEDAFLRLTGRAWSVGGRTAEVMEAAP